MASARARLASGSADALLRVSCITIGEFFLGCAIFFRSQLAPNFNTCLLTHVKFSPSPLTF